VGGLRVQSSLVDGTPDASAENSNHARCFAAQLSRAVERAQATRGEAGAIALASRFGRWELAAEQARLAYARLSMGRLQEGRAGLTAALASVPDSRERGQFLTDLGHVNALLGELCVHPKKPPQGAPTSVWSVWYPEVGLGTDGVLCEQESWRTPGKPM
jgi:hypothetical protein